MTHPGGSIELRDYFRFLTRHRAWLAVPPLLGVLGGAVALNLVPSRYVAVAEVQARNVTTDPFGSNGPGVDRTLSMPTERAIAVSRDVAAEVARTLGGDPGELSEGLEVRVPDSTQVLRFEYGAADPQRAAAGANAFAGAYLEVRGRRVTEDADAVQRAITSRVEQLSRQLTAAKKEDVTERAQLTSQIGDLRKQADALAVIDTRPGYVTQKAVPPALRAFPTRLTFLAGGLVLGLLAGLALAFARQLLDTRIRRPEELSGLLDRPVLSGLGRDSQAQLAARLVNLSGDEPQTVLVAFPASPAEAGQAAAACGGLGTALAGFGKSVRIEDHTGPEPMRSSLPKKGKGASADRPDYTLVGLPVRPGAAHILGLGHHADQAVLIVPAERTRAAEVHDLRALLTEFSVPVTGALLLS
ncbi:hypothetical protein [Nonomuraea soli]|uniref:Capsular polysaccharide biosynthesis protein n=1 Tax=Nonomuraea soli TaxID=1032476 RepID=A0A7W0HWD3_9ACTN|nr:hypothetical protein [Nonomuraea soli]MBA2897982.1 capsular polysaccharide biosynthesis protein [Nonomuraea soli]